MRKEITLQTSQKQEIIDITKNVQKVIDQSKISEGICYVYVRHATAAIIINESWDPNIQTDTLDLLNQLIPKGKWLHDKVDGNADAHLKASLLGPGEFIPIKNKKLYLGRWQAIMLCDFDGPRERNIVIDIK